MWLRLERSTCKSLVTGQVTFLNPWSRWYMNIVLHFTNLPYGWTQKPMQSIWLFDLFTPNFESKSLCSHRILGSLSPTNPRMNPAVWIVYLCLAFMHSTKKLAHEFFARVQTCSGDFYSKSVYRNIIYFYFYYLVRKLAFHGTGPWSCIKHCYCFTLFFIPSYGSLAWNKRLCYFCSKFIFAWEVY